MSRLPVREALRRLHVEGLVELQPRRGYFVASFNRGEEIGGAISDIRGTLEAKAAYYATQRRDELDVAELRGCSPPRRDRR